MSDFNIIIDQDPNNINISIDPDIDQTNINVDNQHTAPVLSVNGKIGFVTIDKTDIGLSEVDNISISGVSGYLKEYFINSSSGYITGVDLSSLYPRSNPSGFITGVDLSNYATVSNLIITGSNLQSQINNLDSVYATDASVTAVANNLAVTGSTLQTRINTVTTNLAATGSNLQLQINNLDNNYASQTEFNNLVQNVLDIESNLQAQFDTLDNNYASQTEIDNLTQNVVTTGQNLNQKINNYSGFVNSTYVTKSNGQFTDRPKVNNSGVLLQGEIPSLPENIVYTTGNQVINGAKQFFGFPLQFGAGARLEIDEEFLTMYYGGSTRILSSEESSLFDLDGKHSIEFHYRNLKNLSNQELLNWSGPNVQFFGSRPTYNGSGLALVGLFNVTYNQLKALKNSGQLDPGRIYRISDFILKWRIDSEYTDQILSGSGIEPLYVSASTTNSLYETAYSELYPNDIIYYDVDATGCKTWGVNANKSIPDFKGWISRRIDRINNIDITWDWRNIKVNCCKLDLSSIPTFNQLESYSSLDLVKYGGNLYFLSDAYGCYGASCLDNTPSDINNTALLLHMNGDNFSTNFSDSSYYPVYVQNFGNVYQSQGIKKFGSSSARFDGNGDYLKINNSYKFDFASNNFTIEFWMYPLYDTDILGFNRTGTLCTLAYNSVNLYYLPNIYIGLSKNPDYPNVYQLAWGVKTGFSSTTTILPKGSNNNNFVYLNDWQHVSYVRNGTGLYLYLNGNLISNYNIGNNFIYNNTEIILGGSNIIYNSNFRLNYYEGFIDEFRILTGVAKYTGNFTPPTAEYQNTQFLSPYWKRLLPTDVGSLSDQYFPTQESNPLKVLMDKYAPENYHKYEIPFNTGSRKQFYTFITNFDETGLNLTNVKDIKMGGISNLFLNNYSGGFSNNEIYSSAYSVFNRGFSNNEITYLYKSIFGLNFNNNKIRSINDSILKNNIQQNEMHDISFIWIGNGCSSNEIDCEMAGNTLGDNFINNKIKSQTSFLFNQICDNFQFNDLNGDYIQYNLIDFNFQNNISTYRLLSNTFEINFISNKIYDIFEKNYIGANSYNNVFHGVFKNNSITDNVSLRNNIFNFGCQNIEVVNYGAIFQSNLIDTYLSGNYFSNGISTHVFNEYNTRIFKNSLNVNRLSYYGPADQLIVTDIDA